MFTGIVEITVPVGSVAAIPAGRRLTLPCPWADAKVGQSVAVNGCCLTIAELLGAEGADPHASPPPEYKERGKKQATAEAQGMGEMKMSFDVILETLAKTNLGLLKPGDAAHLERSLQLSDRLDGHIVQGHVDGVGRLVKRIETAEECRLTIQPPGELVKYIVPKGSVCLDGVSLTIAAVNGDQFEVALIPTTLNLTALGKRPEGWLINLETDILAKTIVFWLERQAVVGKTGVV